MATDLKYNITQKTAKLERKFLLLSDEWTIYKYSSPEKNSSKSLILLRTQLETCSIVAFIVEINLRSLFILPNRHSD